VCENGVFPFHTDQVTGGEIVFLLLLSGDTEIERETPRKALSRGFFFMFFSGCLLCFQYCVDFVANTEDLQDTHTHTHVHVHTHPDMHFRMILWGKGS
jgi:hypothetical protein